MRHPCVLIVPSILLTLVPFAGPSFGAGRSGAATASNDRYAATVLEDVFEKWMPPRLVGSFSVRIRLDVDARGRLAACRVTKPSVLEAFDRAACGAAERAQPFGAPPDGPVSVDISLRIGDTARGSGADALSLEDAMKAEQKARNRAERQMEEERASRAEDAARERAMRAAEGIGAPLPDVRAEPPAPPARRTKDATAGEKRRRPAFGLSGEERDGVLVRPRRPAADEESTPALKAR
ncbi:MAG: TonB C-terminal domain-containing protein [Desulfovibrio sp.]|nr:TonB C-terminal domain-containing protein [Desulfovibrio sp.]